MAERLKVAVTADSFSHCGSCCRQFVYVRADPSTATSCDSPSPLRPSSEEHSKIGPLRLRVLNMDQLRMAVADVSNPQEQEPSPVQVRLHPPEIWRLLREHTHEMAVGGRKILPRLEVKISGLKPLATYWVAMQLLPVSNARWVFSDYSWVPRGTAKKAPPAEQSLYMHPYSPMTGSDWNNITVLFEDVRLKSSDEQVGNLKVHLRHKYVPRILIFEGTPENWQCTGFPLPDAEFIAVAFYHNRLMPHLKPGPKRNKSYENFPRLYPYTDLSNCSIVQALLSSGSDGNHVQPANVANCSVSTYKTAESPHILYPTSIKDERLENLLSPCSSVKLNSNQEEGFCKEGVIFRSSPIVTVKTETELIPDLTDLWSDKPVSQEYTLPLTPTEPTDSSFYSQCADIVNIDTQPKSNPSFRKASSAPPPLIPIPDEMLQPRSKVQNHHSYHSPMWKSSQQDHCLSEDLDSGYKQKNKHSSNQGMQKNSYIADRSYSYPGSVETCIKRTSLHVAEQVHSASYPCIFHQTSAIQASYGSPHQPSLQHDSQAVYENTFQQLLPGTMDTNSYKQSLQAADCASQSTNYFAPAADCTSLAANYSSPAENSPLLAVNYSLSTANSSSVVTNYSSPSENYSSPYGNYSSPAANYSSPAANYSSPAANYSSSANYSSHSRNFNLQHLPVGVNPYNNYYTKLTDFEIDPVSLSKPTPGHQMFQPLKQTILHERPAAENGECTQRNKSSRLENVVHRLKSVPSKLRRTVL